MTDIKAEDLRSLLDYSIVSGRFYWKNRTKYSRMKPGDPAGHLKTDGYVTIRVEGKSYKAHRLAWLWVTGEHPSKQVDHINHHRSANGWHNLREATPAENAANRVNRTRSTHGIRNLHVMRGEFRARVMKEGKTYYGIARATPLEASKDAEELRQRLYGQFATQH